MIKDKYLIDKIDEYGRVHFSTEEFIEYLLNGRKVDNIYIEDESEYEKYLKACDKFNHVPIKVKRYENLHKKYTRNSYLKEKAAKWLIPEECFEVDLVSFLSQRCVNEVQKTRLVLELEEFYEREQIDLLYVLIYLVDTMRKNDIVWGIGRGSSVASFILYLIGINKIDPIEYDIDYREFFK